MPVVGAQEQQTQVVVIGGGPGGYAAAFRAADLGKKVTLVERREHLGGVCLLEGCIPSKAMIGAAELLASVRAAGQVGIVAENVSLRMEKLAAWRDGVVAQLAKGVEVLAKRRGVQWLRGSAYLVEPHRLHLADCDVTDVHFEQAVIAVGSRPAYPAALAPNGQRILTSRELLVLKEVPGRLLVVGGGYIGLELGTCFRLLGSDVTIVELTQSLLPGTDADLVEVVARALKAEGIHVHLRTEVVSAEESPEGVRATLRPAGGEPTTQPFDCVLVAVGRRPNTDDLGLERIGIAKDQAGFIEIDQQCRTSLAHVFAIGDCTLGPMLAHKARRQGIVAAEALCGRPAAFDNRTVPAVIFSHPEIAYGGLSEEEARGGGRQVKVGRFWFRANARALTMPTAYSSVASEGAAVPPGFVKVIADADTQEVLGVRIVGPGASELIAEATLAIEMGALVEDLMGTIHAHPTLGETLHEAAEATLGQALHLYDVRAASR